MTLPVLLALRRANPGIRLLLATKTAYAPLFQKIPGAEVFPIDTKQKFQGLTGLWKLFRALRQSQPTGVADLHNVLRTRILGMFFTLAGTPVRRQDKGRAEKKALTAAQKPFFRPLKTTHQRYAEVFDSLGFPLELTPADILPKEPWPEAFASLRVEGHLRLGFAPFAAHAGKCYPEALTERVLALLEKEPGLTVYLLGGGARETEILEGWAARFGNCVSLAGKAGLEQELALISNLDLMVAMDSGNGHLAAMYGVPVLTLWGVTHPYLGFAPYGQPEAHALVSDREQYPAIPTSVYGNKVPAGYESVMESIPPEEVASKILEFLRPPGQAMTTGERDRK